MKRFLLFLALVCSTTIHSLETDLYFPTFKEGFYRNGRSESTYKKRLLRDKAKAKESLYTEMYESSVAKLLLDKNSGSTTIPKVVHVIWLGSTLPEKYAEWLTTWQGWDGWEFRLWTDKEASELEMVNREIFESSKSYGEKSDILRYEILYQFGGLYVDTDFACFNPEYFDAFHRSLDLYIAFLPAEYVLFRMGNSIIGSVPNHPFLLQLITELNHNFKKKKGAVPMAKTGTAYFTHMMELYLSEGEENRKSVTLLPPSFFYPFTHNEIKTEVKGGLRSIQSADVAPETCAIHFWEGSWSKNKPKKPSTK